VGLRVSSPVNRGTLLELRGMAAPNYTLKLNYKLTRTENSVVALAE